MVLTVPTSEEEFVNFPMLPFAGMGLDVDFGKKRSLNIFTPNLKKKLKLLTRQLKFQNLKKHPVGCQRDAKEMFQRYR